MASILRVMQSSRSRRPLRQRAVDHTAALAVAALLYLPVVWAYRDERKAGQR